MALVARRLSLRSRLRRLPPRVAARGAAVVDRRRALRPRGGRGAGPRAGARVRSPPSPSACARFAAERGRRGLIVFAIDTELLGHWWWEGPDVAGGGARDRRRPRGRAGHARRGAASARARGAPAPALELGRGQGPAHLGLARGRRPRLGGAAARAAAAARARRRASPGRAAERAARELLALQASDWAFLDSRRQAGDYPWQRTHRPRPAPCSRP